MFQQTCVFRTGPLNTGKEGARCMHALPILCEQGCHIGDTISVFLLGGCSCRREAAGLRDSSSTCAGQSVATLHMCGRPGVSDGAGERCWCTGGRRGGLGASESRVEMRHGERHAWHSPPQKDFTSSALASALAGQAWGHAVQPSGANLWQSSDVTAIPLDPCTSRRVWYRRPIGIDVAMCKDPVV